MRTSIQILPKDLSEKIAAGEVIERPGSVIKELIENSIDAQADNILIEIEDGGRKRMLVSDNGTGIPDDEIAIALQRHATSKISKIDDLWNISTMGFRGEALPSIATVSRFTIESRAEGFLGKKLYFEGAGLKSDSSSIDPRSLLTSATGTVITVEDLFYNVPARLKFLKARSSETSHIRELIERTAICNEHIAFLFLSEGRQVLKLNASTDRAQRFAEIISTDSSHIEAFDLSYESISVTGYFDRHDRANQSRHVYLCVNGRMVRDKLLMQATISALRPIMMEGEYPRVFLDVRVDPADIDVNVHPAKSEVRFRQARDVFQTVHAALSKLSRAPAKVAYSINTEASVQPPLLDVGSYQYRTRVDVPDVQLHSQSQLREQKLSYAPTPLNRQTIESINEHYIGQLKNTYLLFQDDQGLTFIDQHAADERVNYEKIKARFIRDGGLKPQPMLISKVVKCKPDEVALALDLKEVFSKFGFEIEVFGDQSVIIRSAPEGLDPNDSHELFMAILEQGKESSSFADSTDLTMLSPKLERVFSTAACHSSIRAGQPLSEREARALAFHMDQTKSSGNCPHGRPSMIKISFTQIEDWFKRRV